MTEETEGQNPGGTCRQLALTILPAQPPACRTSSTARCLLAPRRTQPALGRSLREAILASACKGRREPDGCVCVLGVRGAVKGDAVLSGGQVGGEGEGVFSGAQGQARVPASCHLWVSVLPSLERRKRPGGVRILPPAPALLGLPCVNPAPNFNNNNKPKW